MLDWDDLRFFLAVTRHGNLSAAARELHVTQPTVGRRLASLESNLGVRLLNRTPDGYVLTTAGSDVQEKAERLEKEAKSLERAVAGRDTRLEGLVRVTCAETVAAHLLAPCFMALHVQHTDIVVELVPDPKDLSLSMREADLSVRLSQPDQHDLVVRRIGSIAFALYASPAYLSAKGDVDFADGCRGHCVITQMNDIENPPQFAWLADLTPRARTAFQTSSHEAAVSAALSGVGIACLGRFRADKEAGLIRLDAPTEAPASGLWLVVHKDNRDTLRIRAVMNHIAESVRSMRGQLMPESGSDTNSDNSGG